MVLWRISRHRDLHGTGGLRASGRWHFAGQPVVYLVETPAAALLEVCVHTAANDVPPSFTLLQVEGPDLEVEVVQQSVLPIGWRDEMETTQMLGTRWLRESTAVLLAVPSAIVPRTQNFLFNPAHADASRFKIVEMLEYPFDGRLKL